LHSRLNLLQASKPSRVQGPHVRRQTLDTQKPTRARVPQLAASSPSPIVVAAVNPGASGSGQWGNRLYTNFGTASLFGSLLPFAERNKSNCLVSNGKVADNLSKAG